MTYLRRWRERLRRAKVPRKDRPVMWSYVTSGECQSCGEPFDRREGGYDCACQRNGHKTDACLGLEADCVCGPEVVTRKQIDRVLSAIGPVTR